MNALCRRPLIILAAAAVALWLTAVVGLTSARAASADAPLAVVTIVEGEAVLMRQTQRLRVAEGTRLVTQDIIETPAEARSMLRVEFTDGLAVNLGPATRLLIDPQFHGERGRLARVYLLSGWIKLKAPPKAAAGAPRAPALLASPALDVLESDGNTVLHLAGPAFSFFVESGSVAVQERRLTNPVGSPRSLRGGQFLARGEAAAATVASRPDPAFIERMPRVFLDTLPDRAALFRERSVVPKPIGGIAYADVADWLAAEPTLRRPSMKRWRELTRDAAFRTALVANMRAHPEWDRVLFPEKYRSDK